MIVTASVSLNLAIRFYWLLIGPNVFQSVQWMNYLHSRQRYWKVPVAL